MTTQQLRILIVDDEPERSRGWARKIESLGVPSISVTALNINDARVIIEAADSRRRESRKGVDPFSIGIECALDDVDVLIVDYDLQELLEVGNWSTGLQVATLARAYSRVKLIVLVNQFGTNTFDLTLSKSVQSHADFDVGSDQLLNPAFWDRTKLGGYSPWAWNDGLLRAPARIEATVQWMKSNLDRSVVKALGFTTDVDSGDGTYLAKELWQECLSDPNHTFRELVRESEFLTQKDREKITLFDEPCARVATALISHWLYRWLIPANELLIDLPHLASSYPWLLCEKEEIGCWQQTASLDDGFNALLPKVREYEFAPGFPLARPVVWRQKIIHDPELAEPNGFTYDSFPDLVFCEDTSLFHEFKDTRPFSCRLPGSDQQRFVADPAKVKVGEGLYQLDGVLYEPSVFFSL